MSRLLLAGWVGLLAFTFLTALGSLVAAVARRREGWPRDAAASARRLVLLRLMPAASAAILVVGLVVPAFLVWEPESAAERLGPWSVLIGLVATLPLMAGAWRGLRSWSLTRRVTAAWARDGEPLELAFSVPAHVIDHPFPLMTVVGVLSPRLFVARQVLAALTPAQLTAGLAHEAAHLLRRDNLVRLAMHVWPCWVALLRRPSRLERDWAEAAERAADDRSTGALDLAEALVVLARLTPPGAPLRLAGSSITGDGELAARVRALLDRTGDHDRTVARRSRPATRWLAVLASGAVLVAINVLPTGRAVHAACELLVRLLA